MEGPGTVTVWLNRLKAGENREEAVVQLWERYFVQLVRMARQHLRGRRAVGDEEDAALSAFHVFVQAVEGGKMPELDDRNDLWRMLLTITANKAKNAVRDENRLKRGGGLERGSQIELDDHAALAGVPDPAEAVALADSVERFMAALDDEPELRQIAVWRLEGKSVQEIAGQMGRSIATAERKLKRVREIWTERGFE